MTFASGNSAGSDPTRGIVARTARRLVRAARRLAEADLADCRACGERAARSGEVALRRAVRRALGLRAHDVGARERDVGSPAGHGSARGSHVALGRVELEPARAGGALATQAEPAEGARADRRRRDPPDLGDERPERIHAAMLTAPDAISAGNRGDSNQPKSRASTVAPPPTRMRLDDDDPGDHLDALLPGVVVGSCTRRRRTWVQSRAAGSGHGRDRRRRGGSRSTDRAAR